MMNDKLDRRAAPGAGRWLVCLSAVALLAVPAAIAQVWTEDGDAGDLLGTAQITLGTGGLTTIAGVLAGHDDVDLYCIQLTATPPAGLPLVSLQCLQDAGPSPWLFDAVGMGVRANQVCSGGMKILTAPNVSLAPGLYYVAVSHPGREPSSAGGDIWQIPALGPQSPDGPGAGSGLLSWPGTLAIVPPASYQMTLGWMTFCDGATPAERASWSTLKSMYGN
ncbi:MAG: hypothetical protein Q7W56_03485 [Candidatus Latescibacteria bacterium]|nr:hypothetical protein [Candidatus Latescibacterota bacterium]